LLSLRIDTVAVLFLLFARACSAYAVITFIFNVYFVFIR